ncbi:MAG: long-chain fatty acid--CoA ligase [Prevotella sp.]|nr:long-chain fatty acid--CoA ligase [Prevotella sp.]
MQEYGHLSNMIFAQAERYGRRELFIYKDFGGSEWKSCSFAEAAERSRQVANALLNMGVGVQENIGIFSQNALQYLLCDFGAWAIRAVTIPFYATSSEEQIQFMASDAQIRILFVGQQEQYDKARRIFTLCPTLQHIVVFDEAVAIHPNDTFAIHFSDFMRRGEGLPRQSEVDARTRAATYDDLANILYTSGTTGQSKGVMLRHSQYRAAFQANIQSVPVCEQDRVMMFLPYTHIFERAWDLLAIGAGARIIVNTDPHQVQQSMRETHPTCMSSVPRFWEKVYVGVRQKIESSNPATRAMFEHALKVGRRHNIEYVFRQKHPPLALHLEYELINKTIFSLVRKELGLDNAHFFPTAGAAVSAEVEEFILSIGLNMMVGYGLTESLATVSNCHFDKPITIGSVGRPIPGIQVKIADTGEVMLKGPTVTPGYYRRDDLTRQAFDQEGFFHTGDAGYIKDGELFLTDRIKDLFKTSNGKYIAPQMIEAKLLVDKFIDQVAVIADERKFVSALIIPDYALLEQYARSNNIAFSCREDLCADSQIHNMLQERIDTLQQQLAQYEKVKRFTLLPHHFTMERGELTNTLKIRRKVVAENYRRQIDAMYEE